MRAHRRSRREGDPIRYRRILITGVPGSCKTTTGEFLAAHFGFVHVDLEAPPHLRGDVLVQFLAELDQCHRNIVVTWGFVPGFHDGDIAAIRGLGYRLYWFDGDREASKRLYLERDERLTDEYNEQMHRIEAMRLRKLKAVHVDPFDAEGNPRHTMEIASVVTGAQ